MKIQPEDIKKFIPIDSLVGDNLVRLTKEVKIKQLPAGTKIFERGDKDKLHIYLLAGKVEMDPTEIRQQLVSADTEQARYALANLKPRQYSGRAKTDVTIMTVNSDLLDKLLTWDQTTWQPSDGLQVTEISSSQNTDWMQHLLKTKAFLHLPTSSIDGLFRCIEETPVKAGELIIKQGNAGDYYYIIQSGKCEISRTTSDGKEVSLAELGEGDCFGEEALISNQPRNANARMIIDGVLMRLSRADFTKLLQQPLVKSVSSKQAGELLKQGGLLIDTRLENEHQNDGKIKGSINMPLYMLRLKTTEIDKSKKYILYCDTGARSAAAAFLLSERGFDAYVLKGGLSALIGNAKS